DQLIIRSPQGMLDPLPNHAPPQIAIVALFLAPMRAHRLRLRSCAPSNGANPVRTLAKAQFDEPQRGDAGETARLRVWSVRGGRKGRIDDRLARLSGPLPAVHRRIPNRRSAALISRSAASIFSPVSTRMNSAEVRGSAFHSPVTPGTGLRQA